MTLAASAADPTPGLPRPPRPSPIGFAYNLLPEDRRTGGTEGALEGRGRHRQAGAAARFTRFATRAAAFFADYV